MAHDIVIRGGRVVDGTGRPASLADVAIDGDRISAVGSVDGAAKRTLDAGGLLVTPGFVDIHSHLDAQVMWDPQMTSPCWHGITSVVIGNCGLSLAPCRPEDLGFLVKLLEWVEDIPAASILAGNRFDGGSFGDYLDLLERLPKGVNVGGLVGHCAVRFHAMGERSMDEAPAKPEDVARMCGLVDEAMAGGALGFSTTRSLLHRTSDERYVPGTFAAKDELLEIGRVLGRHGRGVFGWVSPVERGDAALHAREIDWMAEISRECGRPLTFAVLQNRDNPRLYRELLKQIAAANAAGSRLVPQTEVRSVGVVVGLANVTPFDQSLAWLGLKGLSLAQKLAALRDPAQRERLIREGDQVASEANLSMLYQLAEGDARYDFGPEQSLWAIAKRRGVSPARAFVDIELEREGQGQFIFPFANHEIEAVGELLGDPHMVLGLADSGAHVGQICDSSFSTYFLHYWVQERGLFSLEEGIRKLTSEPARLFGLADRGEIREGAFADLNLIDLDRLRVHPPEYRTDFPAGVGRFVQRASGYAATLVNGELFMEGDRHAGAFAGRVLCG